MKTNLKKQSKDNVKKTFGWRIVSAVFVVGFFAALGVAIFFAVAWLQMPPMKTMLSETRLPTVTFLDRDGFEIRSENKIMGTPVTIATLPPHVWQSIIAIEDRRFFKHGAVDIMGLSRALVTNVMAWRVVAGGSSLTQQTAKNIFLSPKRTMTRKAQELILSVWLERNFTKNQILELYMNRVSLSGGMRGIDAAARNIFGKRAVDLSLADAARIAAMLKAPTTYNPIKNPTGNTARAAIVLKEMVRQKYITLDDARAAARDLSAPVSTKADGNMFRYWTDYVVTNMDEYPGDIIVWTTLDSGLQQRAAASLRDIKTQGAVVAMDYRGAIRAMVGGTNYQVSQFNRVTAKRQPGSAFKIVSYLVALENGWMPDTYVNDSPFSSGDYSPGNYNDKFYGDVSLTTAFAKSANSVPLKIAETFGIGSVVKMAAKLGIGGIRREYASVLGASETTLMNLTAMNVVVWNGGFSARPWGIEKITDTRGKILWPRDVPDAVELLDPDVAENMQTMLAAVTRPGGGGTGTRAHVAGKTRGGKTGTSNDFRDAVFVGAIRHPAGAETSRDDLVIGVWVGNDDFTPMQNETTGGTVPAETFRNIIE
ncbi:MAG: transglycosylase domain-containing protein [Rickettsiales bacterium]|jgi:penicillin-binding protein 1A|nr:transglycosylase domain-containing protein [Rickettsiales bacterium]